MQDDGKINNLLSRTLKEKGGILRDKMEKNKAQIQDQFSKMSSSLNENARKKAIDFSNELIALAPLIEAVGYRTKGISIAVGIPPSLTFHFENYKEIDAETRTKILEENKDKELFGTIVKALVTADEFQSNLDLGLFKLGTIDLTLGVPPGVNIQLVPK